MIDKSFVDQVTTSSAAGGIIQVVVGLGHALGMGVVAEGVETEDQMRMLVEAGCTHLQGYLFSAPLVRADLEKAFALASGFTTGHDARPDRQAA